jgi:sulfur relay (sulfurtransferase) complex TusBCD TusD component (DsrE family)
VQHIGVEYKYTREASSLSLAESMLAQAQGEEFNLFLMLMVYSIPLHML